jgi:hypothetical protein
MTREEAVAYIERGFATEEAGPRRGIGWLHTQNRDNMLALFRGLVDRHKLDSEDAISALEGAFSAGAEEYDEYGD